MYDSSDPGFQILDDDEFTEIVREESVQKLDDLNCEVKADKRPSTAEEFAGLETALKWMERQPVYDHIQLSTVKRFSDLAAQKRIKTIKQLTLSEIFSKLSL